MLQVTGYRLYTFVLIHFENWNFKNRVLKNENIRKSENKGVTCHLLPQVIIITYVTTTTAAVTAAASEGLRAGGAVYRVLRQTTDHVPGTYLDN